MDQLNVDETTQALVAGSEEHDALMIEKFEDQSKEPVTETSDRPSWLPEKFKSPEDMAAAYAELERKQSTKQGEAETPAQSVETAQEAVTDAGLDFNAFSAEFEATGALSAESYAALEAKGFPRELVDEFIEGQQAVAAQYRNEILAEAGGEDAYQDMVQWAAQNLSPTEIAAFNRNVDSRDISAAKLAVAALMAKYEANYGREPTLLRAENGRTGENPFRSLAELTAAMKDPRYKKDPAYRDDVDRRLEYSDIY